MNTVKERVFNRKLIAIVRGLPPKDMAPLAEALQAGGIDLIEVTFAQHAPETFGETAAAIRLLRDSFAQQVLPGAGTVLTLDQLQMACDAGAQYIISPGADRQIIERTKALGLLSFPGALTPTEIADAWAWGADAVKIFPAGSLGPAYIKAVKAPLSHIPLMAVGGVHESNAAAFLQAGACGLGVGGSLVNREWIAAGEWPRITELARAYRRAVDGLHAG